MKLNIKYLAIAILYISFFGCKNGGAGTEKTTINGHKYTIINDVPGENAKEGDYVYFRYVVRTKDSVLFSSTQQTPIIKFKLPKAEKTDPAKSQPITEVLANMSKGDSAVATHVLDEGMKKQINLPGVNALYYDIVLIDIKSEADYKKDMEEDSKAKAAKMAEAQAKMPELEKKTAEILADYKSGKSKGQIKTTASGLKYIIYEEGNGPQIRVGDMVKANYYGMLVADGKRFDDSFSKGENFSFPLGAGQVIKGWDEGFALLKGGAKATFFIPASLGWGAAGSPPMIPADAEVMFYVEAL